MESPTGDTARYWYAGAMVAAVLHLVPAKQVLQAIDDIKAENGDGKRNMRGMQTLQDLTWGRFFLSDFAACALALVATCLVMEWN